MSRQCPRDIVETTASGRVPASRLNSRNNATITEEGILTIVHKFHSDDDADAEEATERVEASGDGGSIIFHKNEFRITRIRLILKSAL